MRLATSLVCLVLAACSPQTPTRAGTMPDLDGIYEFASLEVVNDAGQTLEFDVYLAQTFEQQRRGLMFVRHMPETTGMLFIYEGEDTLSIWMKNTFIPLDIVFARGDGSVTNVVRDATPRTLHSHVSTEPARFVLELNAGSSRRFGIGNRSRLIWSVDE